MNKPCRQSQTVPFFHVSVSDSFWAPRQRVMSKRGLPYQYEELARQGCTGAFAWKPGMPEESWRFRDSDLAKWIEAAAYALTQQANPTLEKQVDDYIATLGKAQHADGYINSYYGLVKTTEKYANLRSNHELYRMGHLIEAAIAYDAATGKREFLDVMIRCAQGMAKTFGRQPGMKRGYCGHEEVELALVRLYQHTGDRQHLELARYFVEERGQRPHYFDLEAEARGERVGKDNHDYYQAHKPVREQDKPVGHAVRAVYLYAAMADLALETNDATLIPPLRKLWREILDHQLYIHGGIGQTVHGERFTFPYDLPNETAYAETCAAIGMVLWAHRMLQLEPRGEYGDLMERALYNSVATGTSLDATRYSYAHPLTVFPGTDPHQKTPHSNPKHLHGRYPWFEVPCCPPNLARVLLSIGGYVYTTNSNNIWVNLYMAGKADLSLGDRRVGIEVETDYPWDGNIVMRITESDGSPFTLNLRFPAWCRKFGVKINGRKVSHKPKDGYVALKGAWKAGDTIQMTLAMPIEAIETHPAVWQNADRVALMRGPILYCVEEVDNDPRLMNLTVIRRSLQVRRRETILDGVPILVGKATTHATEPWKGRLYQPAPTRIKTQAFTAIPYCLWDNRTPGNMTVWVRIR